MKLFSAAAKGMFLARRKILVEAAFRAQMRFLCFDLHEKDKGAVEKELESIV